MSFELNPYAPHDADPVPRGPGVRRLVLDAILIVVGSVAVAACAGLVWKSLWHAPQGFVRTHEWVLEYESYTTEFSGTGLYVLVAFTAGLFVALVAAFALERDELVTLAALLVGAALAAWVMYAVGHRLGPPDPRVLALTRADGDTLPADLTVQGGHHVLESLRWVPKWQGRLPGAPFLAWPLGTALGVGFVYFLFPGRGSHANPAPEWSPPGR